MKEHTNPCMLAASTDGVQTTETNSFEITTFETCSFETTFIWNFFIWDHSHLRPIHLRSYSFETAFIWDFFIWDRTVIWDHIHLRPHSFQITFILRHVQSEAVLIYCESHFYDQPFTSLRETWSFARWLFIWSFARLRPPVSKVTPVAILEFKKLGCHCGAKKKVGGPT